MTTTVRRRLAPLAMALAALSATWPARAQGLTDTTALHDPLQGITEQLDDTGREVLAAYPSFDAARILQAVKAIEARAGTPAARPEDGYIAALGYLELLVIRRHYAREDEEHMPAALRDETDDGLSERGLTHALAFAQKNPKHSDVERVAGELISFQISGPVSGMRKGPEARAAIDRALQKDDGNAWAHFAVARMHFHNPAMFGGDKDAALRELRILSRTIQDFRVSLYLARCYQWKELPAQARYWARVAERQAPDNPEVRALLEQVRAAAAEE